MANIKSAKKRVLVSRAYAERNKSIRSAVKTAIKKVEAAVQAGDRAAAAETLKACVSVIEKAGTEGVYHSNNVARKVSRLSKMVSDMK